MADQSVSGYYNANGTYVNPYIRTSPNETKADNYSTVGNTNPYTGKAGIVNPYKVKNPSYNQPNNSYGGYSK